MKKMNIVIAIGCLMFIVGITGFSCTALKADPPTPTHHNHEKHDRGVLDDAVLYSRKKDLSVAD